MNRNEYINQKRSYHRHFMRFVWEETLDAINTCFWFCFYGSSADRLRGFGGLLLACLFFLLFLVFSPVIAIYQRFMFWRWSNDETFITENCEKSGYFY